MAVAALAIALLAWALWRSAHVGAAMAGGAEPEEGRTPAPPTSNGQSRRN